MSEEQFDDGEAVAKKTFTWTLITAVTFCGIVFTFIL
jgi:hypothetical protein